MSQLTCMLGTKLRSFGRALHRWVISLTLLGEGKMPGHPFKALNLSVEVSRPHSVSTRMNQVLEEQFSSHVSFSFPIIQKSAEPSHKNPKQELTQTQRSWPHHLH